MCDMLSFEVRMYAVRDTDPLGEAFPVTRLTGPTHALWLTWRWGPFA
jgi:hypothetical protein